MSFESVMSSNHLLPLLPPVSSCVQSFPASGSFPMSQFFTSRGQSIGAPASALVLPVNIQENRKRKQRVAAFIDNTHLQRPQTLWLLPNHRRVGGARGKVGVEAWLRKGSMRQRNGEPTVREAGLEPQLKDSSFQPIKGQHQWLLPGSGGRKLDFGLRWRRRLLV